MVLKISQFLSLLYRNREILYDGGLICEMSVCDIYTRKGREQLLPSLSIYLVNFALNMLVL